MKVIFLDIDGVLNTGENRDRLRDINQHDNWNYNNIFCRKSLKNLKEIQTVSGAYIVLHSSRRFDRSNHSLAIPLKIQFMDWGLDPYHIDSTPALTGVKDEEIRYWLASHKVRSFVILDDEALFTELAPNWIACDPYKGITDDVKYLSIKLLTTHKAEWRK